MQQLCTASLETVKQLDVTPGNKKKIKAWGKWGSSDVMLHSEDDIISMKLQWKSTLIWCPAVKNDLVYERMTNPVTTWETLSAQMRQRWVNAAFFCSA